MKQKTTKSNRFGKTPKKEVIKENEKRVVNNATILIEQYKKVYDNQIANLKREHTSEIIVEKRKYKNLRNWSLVIGVLVLTIIVLLIWAI